MRLQKGIPANVSLHISHALSVKFTRAMYGIYLTLAFEIISQISR